MKTAMQELKEQIIEMYDNGGDIDLLPVLSHIDLTFLQKEKQQIIVAYEKGFEDIDGEQYYNETFNQ